MLHPTTLLLGVRVNNLASASEQASPTAMFKGRAKILDSHACASVLRRKMYHGSLVRWAFGVLVSVIKIWHLVIG